MAKCCVEVGAVPYNRRYASGGWVDVVHAVSVVIQVVDTSFVAIARARNVMRLNLVQIRLGVKKAVILKSSGDSLPFRTAIPGKL